MKAPAEIVFFRESCVSFVLSSKKSQFLEVPLSSSLFSGMPDRSYQLKPAHQLSTEVQLEGARGLHRQWPQVGLQARMSRLQGDHAYCLMAYTDEDKEGENIGYVQLSPAPALGQSLAIPDNALAGACYLQALFIAPKERGKGLGSHLLGLAEEEARKQGFTYAYLSCRPGLLPFYKGNGYLPTSALMQHSCLSRLSASQLTGLEATLAQKVQTQKGVSSSAADTSSNKPMESPGSHWLRKRLVSFADVHALQPWSVEHVRESVTSALESVKPSRPWAIWGQLVPWMAQIGPSCGLVALGMAMGYFEPQTRVGQSVDDLLQKAIDRGFSRDGELFAIDQLAFLINESGSQLEANVFPCGAKKLREVLHSGHLVVVPYDRDKNEQPCQRSGRSAHYGLVFGLADPLHSPSKEHIRLEEGCYFCGGGLSEAESLSQDVIEAWKACCESPDEDEIQVLLWQGMSDQPLLTAWKALQASNAQLCTLPEMFQRDDAVAGSVPRLSGRMLVLSRGTA